VSRTQDPRGEIHNEGAALPATWIPTKSAHLDASENKSSLRHGHHALANRTDRRRAGPSPVSERRLTVKRQGLYRCTLSTQHSPSARSIPEVLAALPGRLGPGARTPQPVLDLPALDRQIGAFITTYNDRTHSELGISPRDAWVSDGWLPRMPETLEELDGLLLTVPKIRVV
jgi:hypothetical protein